MPVHFLGRIAAVVTSWMFWLFVIVGAYVVALGPEPWRAFLP